MTNSHSQKFSGLVNAKAVGVTADVKRGVVLSLKTKKASQPKNAFTKAILKKGAAPTLATIKGSLINGNTPDYRADLTKVTQSSCPCNAAFFYVIFICDLLLDAIWMKWN